MENGEPKDTFKTLYRSNVHSISNFPLKECELQIRTESFQDTLDHTEFKKELNKKNYKFPSITQRFFNRKEMKKVVEVSSKEELY